MSPDERSACIETAKFCPLHLLGHEYNDCNMKTDPRFLCGTDGCTKHHHKSLHTSTTPFVANIHSTYLTNDPPPSPPENVILTIQTINSTTGAVTCFYDDGSTCCLITYDAADRMNLLGEPVILLVKTAIGIKEMDSHV